MIDDDIIKMCSALFQKGNFWLRIQPNRKVSYGQYYEDFNL